MSDAALSAGILLLALALFVSNKLRHDLVALAAMFACLAAGLIDSRQALLGFADPAVIVVAAVLVVGRAVELTGMAAAITRALVPKDARFSIQLLILMGLAAGLSAFMNNIAALVITMPLATQVARDARLPPGAVLMPLAFATILGGMTTLIGTPANLILSSVRENELGAPFDFFAMTRVGATVAVLGILYLAALGWRLIPVRKHGVGRVAMPWRTFELAWPGAGAPDPLLPRLRAAGSRLLAHFRNGERLAAGEPPRPGDTLLLVSRRSQWDVAEQTGLLPISHAAEGSNAVTARVVVAHGSLLIGQGYDAVHLRSGGKLAVIGGGPRPARLRQPLDRLRIEAGDQLYIRGPATALAAFVARARLLEVDRFDPAPLEWRRAGLTILIFGAAIAAAVAGAAPTAITFLAAAVAVAALQIVPSDEVYRSIDWPIVVLLAAMIPVGQSFESSGAADIVAQTMVGVLQDAPLFLTLAALCAGTLLLSVFLNNVATAVIMGPIAIELSGLLGISPDAALLAVLIGASSDFLTPIGHQNNMLVMSAGGYRFTDYIRVGWPVSLLTTFGAAAFLSLVHQS